MNCEFVTTPSNGQFTHSCVNCHRSVTTQRADPPSRSCLALDRPRGALSCLHRGKAIGMEKCELCGRKGKMEPVYECALHGKCTLRKYKHGKQHKDCIGCMDRKESEDPFAGFRCVLINLKYRADRLEQFKARQKATGWPLPAPRVFEAYSGDKLGVPSWFKQGGGAYGCWLSHKTILERAIMDDVPGLIVFEDDADWDDDVSAQLTRFMDNVPNDWEALWLGGQLQGVTFDSQSGHRRGVRQAEMVADGVLRGYSIERTHAYVIRGQEAMKRLYQTWAHITVHCDWVLGHFQEEAKVYVPEYPIFCQCRGKSDINGRVNPRQCFRPVPKDLPVVVLKAPKEVAQALDAYGFHRGYDRHKDTDIDVGLAKVFNIGETPLERRNYALREWVRTINWECGQDPRLICTAWHPEVNADLLRESVNAEVTELEAGTVEEALKKWPRKSL